MQKEQILFVDDDGYFAYKYEEALRQFFDVICCRDATTAVRHLRETRPLVAAVIDVMMPPPEGKEMETHEGFSTGIWIASECRVAIKKQKIALAFFTNKESFVKGELDYLQLDGDIVVTLKKNETLARDLPSKLKELIAKRSFLL